MAPIVLCLLCLAAVALWAVYSTMCGIRALIISVWNLLVFTIAVLLGYELLRFCLGFFVIMFADFSMFWDIIKEFFRSLGGFWGIIGSAIGIAVFVGICSFLLPILTVIGTVIIYVVGGALGIVILIFEFIEEKAKLGYSVVVAQIYNRLAQNQGGSQ